MEDEMNLLNCKITKLSDSQSESEQLVVTEICEKNNASEDNISRLKKVRRRILDSDSENEETDAINKKTHIIGEHVDNTTNISDVEEDVEVTPHNKSFPDEETAVEAVIYTTNSKGELIQETSSHHVKTSLLALCDPESDEDNDRDVVESTMLEKIIQPRVYKGRKKSKEERPQRMTVKEAAKQREEISSESQRMLRETNFSLPYHKPKSFSIQEFLQKRSKLVALPTVSKGPLSVAIKMSKNQLKEVSKKLDERIKQVEEFYKSESEEEEEELDDPTEEIKSWLNILLEKAMNAAVMNESRMVHENEATKNEETSTHDNSKEQTSVEYEFNLDDIDETDVAKKPNISELIKDKLNIQPKLSGQPEDIIDLDSGVTKPNEVKLLMHKLFQNVTKKLPYKYKVNCDVIEVGTGGEIVKETISMNVDEEEEPALVEVPGAKLQKLKEDLQSQMAQKRLELWKQKREQGELLSVETKPDYEENVDKDILDDEEEEFEMTESDSDDWEEEEDEECVKREKKRKKSAFIDDEACEDEDEVEADVESIKSSESKDKETEEVEEECEEVEEPVEEEVKSPKKRVLKRILKPFSVDSDDEDEDDPNQTFGAKNILKYYATDDDEMLPPNLPRTSETPLRTQREQDKSEFEFLTPVTYLTGLQNLTSESKFSGTSPTSPFCASINPTPEDNFEDLPVSRNLFANNSPVSSQDIESNLENLAQLCSGNFPETQNASSPQDKADSEELPSTLDLLNLCSGAFATLPESSKESTPSQSNYIDKHKTDLQSQSSHNALKGLDEENEIISQLLDEEELERFKKKFESPVNVSFRGMEVLDAEEVKATGLINSDDENEELEVKQKTRKKIVFSDEESDDEDVDDDEQKEAEEGADSYDSDDEEQKLENEIIARESSNYKLNDFLDKEAELSESDWGSADEDERDLDELEQEQGDEETFNEKKMRREIERIQMRQLLDDDNREVKILQELLLEDGELHGTGRKRQFRWKALDSVDSGEFDKRDDDDIFLDEDENEEQWRTMRHKREMFLKKKPTDEDDPVLTDSQILKVGQVILKTKTISSQCSSQNSNKSDECKEPFSDLSKRGSFLSRSDQVLKRLAEYTKETSTVGTTLKNSRGFVFQTCEVAAITVKDNKRKAVEGTPKAVKKLRLDIGQKTATKGSKAKKRL